MGTVFRKLTTRPVPAGAEITEKGGRRLARWKLRVARSALRDVLREGRVAT